jgi:hypothetical protein
MDLTRIMTEETIELTAPPTLLQDARRGGRKRQQRRRALLSVTAVLALLATGYGVTALRSEPTLTRYSGLLFDGRTHGDLAGDSAYLAAVVDAWTHSHGTSGNASRGIFDDLRGTPRVLWAGTTPAGRAAVVAQDAYLHHHGDIQLDHEGRYQLLGFVGPGADGEPRVVGDTYPSPDGLRETAWFVDPARSVVAAVAADGPPGLSSGWTYGPDGTADRNYAPMNDADGVGIATVPAGARPAVALLPYRRFTDAMVILGGPERKTDASRLPWTGTTRLGGAAAPSSASGFPLLSRLLNARRRGAAFEVRGGSWSVVANSGGHTVVVGEIGLDNDPTRVFAVVDGRIVIDGGFVDQTARLPVQVRLPDQLGTVVVRYGADLAYRGAKGLLVDAGRDAALVPAAVTKVQVRVAGQPERTVDLSGAAN